MIHKKFFIAAICALVFAACSDELVETPPVVKPTPQTPLETPIVFGSMSRGTTRAEFTGAEAAKYLNYQFVVSGYKGAQTSPAGTIVFDNYVVTYKENTAHTTESNTSNWEYVGNTLIKPASDKGITQQSTKYWDYDMAQYDFIAWSTGSKTAIYEEPVGGIPAGSVLVSPITPATATGTDGVAYSFKGSAADLTDCYIADLVTVKKAQYGDNPVVIKFRSLGSKVRLGLYETIPGYSVKDVKFYAAANEALPTDATTPRLFTPSANQIFANGTYTIYYPTVNDESNDDNNRAHVRFAGAGDQSSVVNFGSLKYTTREDGEKSTGNVYLGRSSKTASMAGEAEGNYYTPYIPNESGTNLNLRVDFTLESIDGTGETITVKGATATVPSIYTQWKAGFAYTYIFKISDKTNGYTGPYDPEHPDDITQNPDPAGLYPITFDAIVVNDEDGDKAQETITLVSTPSITTYQEGSNVVNADEYIAATGPIYITVNDGTTNNTPDVTNSTVQVLTGKAAIYAIPDGKTEAEIVDALQIPDDNAADGTRKGRNGIVLTEKSLTLTGRVNYGVDGHAIIVGKDKVARFTPEASTTYAFVYTKKAPTETYDKFQSVTKAAGEEVTGLYRDFSLTAASGDAQSGVVYYSKETDGTLTKQTPSLGQSVTGLYTRTGDAEPYTYTAASGYAVTGTTYYNKDGDNYTEATNITYPTQVTGWYIYAYTATEKHACMEGEKALAGHAYFDKYFQNNGVYYTKVIKVQ